MRVLTLGNLYPPQHRGGYELVWQGAVRALRARGHEVRVLCTDTVFADGAQEEDDDVHRALRWYWREDAWPRLALRERWAIERHDREAMDAHVRAFAPDAIAFFPMGGLPMSLVALNRVPAVAVVHDDWMLYGPKVDQWRRVVRTPRLRAPGTCLFVSEFTRGRALASGWRMAASAVAPPGVEDAYLRARPSPPWSWSLLFVGRLDPRKGADVALAALAELPPQATLTVAGVGEVPGATAAGPRVRVLGPVPHGDLPLVYAAADAVVFPSRWEEPWGLVPLEAMALGRPVVATARGGSAEYLRHEVNALVVEPDDPSAVAAAVRRLADDRELRGRLREGGLATAAAYTATRFHRHLESALRRAVGGGPPPQEAGAGSGPGVNA